MSLQADGADWQSAKIPGMMRRRLASPLGGDMGTKGFSAAGFLTRLVLAQALVLATYNPAGYSYFHWLKQAVPAGTVGPLHFLVGVILIIGWVIFLRATLLSLGALGLILAAAFFGTLIWFLADAGIIPTGSATALTWIVLFCLAAVLATGMSWSHIRRRLSGQVTVDDVDQE